MYVVTVSLQRHSVQKIEKKKKDKKSNIPVACELNTAVKQLLWTLVQLSNAGVIVAVAFVIHIASLKSVAHTIFPHIFLHTNAPLPSCATSSSIFSLSFLSLNPLSLVPSFLSFPSIYFTHLHDPSLLPLFTDHT